MASVRQRPNRIVLDRIPMAEDVSFFTVWRDDECIPPVEITVRRLWRDWINDLLRITAQPVLFKQAVDIVRGGLEANRLIESDW
jgi:hypothetical protein